MIGIGTRNSVRLTKRRSKNCVTSRGLDRHSWFEPTKRTLTNIQWFFRSPRRHRHPQRFNSMSAHSVDGHRPHPSNTKGGSPCWYYSDSYSWKAGFFTEFVSGDEPRIPIVDAITGCIVIASFRSVSFAPTEPREAPVKPRVGGGS